MESAPSQTCCAHALHARPRFPEKGRRSEGREVRVETEKYDFSSIMSGLATLMMKTASDESTKLSNLVKQATESNGRSRIARLAILATELAFILLCIFAVRIFSL
jgi:hypothetical protein